MKYLTRKDLIFKLQEGAAIRSNSSLIDQGYGRAMTNVLAWIDKLEATVSEVREYCEKQKDCESCNLVPPYSNHDGLCNNKFWDCDEITKTIRGDK